MRSRRVQVLVCLMFVALVAGCGGGSSNGSPPPIQASPPPPPPELAWIAQAGDLGSCWGTDVAVAPDGTVVVVGGFDDEIVLGASEPNETTLVATGLEDVFVAKFTADGMLLWAVSAVGDQYAAAEDVAVSPNGAITVVGWFFDEFTFDPGGPSEMTFIVPDAGYDDGFVARYLPTGALSWVKTFSSLDVDQALSVAARADGSVVIGGTYGWDLTLGAGEPNEETFVPVGFLEGVLAAYAADGTLLWARTSTTDVNGGTTFWRVAAYPDGSIVAAGEYDVTATLGTQPLVSVDDTQDIHLSHWGPSGTFRWARSIGGGYTDQVFGLGLAPDNTIRLAGDFFTESHFGLLNNVPVTLTAVGVADGFVASYTDTGSVLWAEQIGGTGSDYIYDAYVDPAGGTHVIGYFQGEAKIGLGQAGETTLVSSGTNDPEAFIAGFGSDGLVGWAARFGGVDSDYGQAVAGFGNGDVVFVGSFVGEATLGNEPEIYTAAGDRDLFVVRTEPE